MCFAKIHLLLHNLSECNFTHLITHINYIQRTIVLMLIFFNLFAHFASRGSLHVSTLALLYFYSYGTYLLCNLFIGVNYKSI